MLTSSVLLMLCLSGGAPVLSVDSGAAAVSQPTMEYVKKKVAKPKPKPRKPVKRKQEDDTEDDVTEPLSGGDVAMQGVLAGGTAGLVSVLGAVAGGVLGGVLGVVVGCVSCMATLALCQNQWLAMCACFPVGCGLGTLTFEGVTSLIVAAVSVGSGAAGWLASGIGVKRRPAVWIPFALSVPAGLLSVVVAAGLSSPFLGVAGYYLYLLIQSQGATNAARVNSTDWVMYSLLAMAAGAAVFAVVQVLGALVAGMVVGGGTGVLSMLMEGRGSQDDAPVEKPRRREETYPDEEDDGPLPYPAQRYDPLPDERAPDEPPPVAPAEPVEPMIPPEPSPILPD